jgi:hypothetical protein
MHDDATARASGSCIAATSRFIEVPIKAPSVQSAARVPGARGKRPLVRLVPVNRPVPERKFGALRGRLVVDDTFFDPIA